MITGSNLPWKIIHLVYLLRQETDKLRSSRSHGSEAKKKDMRITDASVKRFTISTIIEKEPSILVHILLCSQLSLFESLQSEALPLSPKWYPNSLQSKQKTKYRQIDKVKHHNRDISSNTQDAKSRVTYWVWPLQGCTCCCSPGLGTPRTSIAQDVSQPAWTPQIPVAGGHHGVAVVLSDVIHLCHMGLPLRGPESRK